jgi:hypothetical protein
MKTRFSHVGGANHPIIIDFTITPKGREFIKQLNLNEMVIDSNVINSIESNLAARGRAKTGRP